MNKFAEYVTVSLLYHIFSSSSLITLFVLPLQKVNKGTHALSQEASIHP